MIAFIRGAVLEVTEHSCLLLTGGGAGYELFLPARSLAGLPKRGLEAEFYVYTLVREDALELYGFANWDERETFRLLLGINRVGAKTALAILDVFSPDDLRRLVLEEDALGLTRAPGIGKKSAQQIFLDLKYKLKGSALPLREPGSPSQAGGLLRDAVAALSNLGYAEEEAALEVREALAGGKDMELGELLRAVLKRFSGRKA